MWDQEDDERNLSGDYVPGISDVNVFLSPVANGSCISPDRARVYVEADNHHRTPTRVLSSHSLAGENFVPANRPPFEFSTDDIQLSPFTHSDGTHTPPLSIPDPMTPPPLNQSASSSVARTMSLAVNITTNGSISGRMRPPRVPHVSLQPSRGSSSRHGRGLSNSEFSFMSALTDGTNDNNSHASSILVGSSSISVPRRRTASWDVHDTRPRVRQSTDGPGSLPDILTQSTPANLLQPILSDDFGTPPKSIVTGARIGSSHGEESVHSLSYQKRKVDETVAVSSNTASTSSSGSQHPMTKPYESFSTVRTNASVESAGRRQASAKKGMVWNPASLQETGSFVALSDQLGDDSQSRTPPNGRIVGGLRKMHGGRTDSRTVVPARYTVENIMDAYPKETTEEALLLSKYESHQFCFDLINIAPRVPQEILADLTHSPSNPYQEGIHRTGLGVSPKPNSSRHESFGELTRKLLHASRGVTMNGQAYRRKSGSARSPMDAGVKGHDAPEASVGKYSVQNDQELERGVTQSSGDSVYSKKNRRGRRDYWARFCRFFEGTQNYLAEFVVFLGPNWPSMQQEFNRVSRWIVIPCLAIAALLFYVIENPSGESKEPYDGGGAKPTSHEVGIHASTLPPSISWWLLFLGVRQCMTLQLAQFSQLVIIDFLIMRTRLLSELLGSSLSLVLAQSKGWPLIAFLWAIWDFVLLYGDRRFVHHWGYWQDLLGLMNHHNPSGDVTSHEQYLRVLVSVVVVSIAEVAKRSLVGQLIGKRTVQNYGEELGLLMRKLVLMCEVSHLSARITDKTDHKNTKLWSTGPDPTMENREGSLEFESAAGDDASGNSQQMDSFDYSDGQSVHSKDTRKFFMSEKLEIMELLLEWEEPEVQMSEENIITMGSVLQFRQALEFVSGECPFSPAFGVVRTRKDCVTSAQMLWERLMRDAPGPFLGFYTLCLIARDKKGDLDRGIVKEMIRVFRPNRSGGISKLEFVKSIDRVYKSLRLLLASIHSSHQIDQVYISSINVGFYSFLSLIVMSIIGVDLRVMIMGLGSIAVSLAFMIGPATSRAFEGILFMLLRKPFNIGDRVSIGDPASTLRSFEGDSSWIVEKMDIYTTTARLGGTQGLATFSNGSLANLRIINLNRSDRPNVDLNLKFSLESSLEQRELFKRRITAFVKERPRHWNRVIDFRSSRVDPDRCVVEYTLILQHRERWQNVGAILESRDEIFSYAVDLAKELRINYMVPRIPSDIQNCSSAADRTTSNITFVDEPKKYR